MKKLIFVLLVLLITNCSTSDQEYLTIHKKAIVADMHSDTALRMLRGFDFSSRDSTGHMDIPRLIEGGIDLQVFACFLSTGTPIEECRTKVDMLIDSLESQISRNRDKIAICKTAAEAEKIIGEKKIAAFLGIENGVAIANSLDTLKHFYDRGIRYMTLTHTASSDWCISSADTAPAFHGLTDFGREVVREMSRLGMIVDISHASVSAVEEILKITTDPVIASHSCVYSLSEHDRNLNDEQIKAIAVNCGVIGINFYNGYLDARCNNIIDSIFESHQAEVDSLRELYKDDWRQRRQAMKHIYNEVDVALDDYGIDVSTVVDHIDYIVQLVGTDYVGLGSDFDGIPWLPKGLKDCSMVPNITKELVARGYSTEDINKILGGNFMRVFQQVCD